MLLGQASCVSRNTEKRSHDRHTATISSQSPSDDAKLNVTVVENSLPDDLINGAKHSTLQESLRKIREDPDQMDVSIAVIDDHTVGKMWLRTATQDYTALQMAAREGEFKVVEGLLKAGACPNAQNSRGKTALHEAASQFRPEVIEALIAAGANVNLQDNCGDTALHSCLCSNCGIDSDEGKKTVSLLAQHKEIDFEIENKIGLTPLKVAEKRCVYGTFARGVIKKAIRDKATHYAA